MTFRRYLLAYLFTPVFLAGLTLASSCVLSVSLSSCMGRSVRDELAPPTPLASVPIALAVAPDSTTPPKGLRGFLSRLNPAAGKARPAQPGNGKVKYRNATINNTYVIGNQNEVKQGGMGKSSGQAQVAADSGATLNAASKGAQLNNAPNNHGTFAPKQEAAEQASWQKYLLSPTGKVIGVLVGAAIVGGCIYGFIWWRRRRAVASLQNKATTLLRSGLGSKTTDFL